MFKIKQFLNTKILLKHGQNIFSHKPKINNFSFQKGEEEVIFETREDKELRYEDELFYFDREWKKLQEDKINKRQDYLSPDLSDHQQREADILLERIMQFSVIEKKYFYYMLKEAFEKNEGTEIGKPNVFDTKKLPKVIMESPENNPNWETTQEILNILTPFIASGYFTGGAPAVSATTEIKTEAKVEEVKKEEKKEKAKYDVKLASFDAAKKIVLIKEVRALLNLGLKEAKELVEKAPVVLIKDCASEQANEILKKLQENGGKIELV